MITEFVTPITTGTTEQSAGTGVLGAASWCGAPRAAAPAGHCEAFEELERQLRCVQIYGYGYLLNHGGRQIALDPKDVTVVIPSTRHMDDFDLNNSLYLAEQRVQVLQERIRKVRDYLDSTEAECAHSQPDRDKDAECKCRPVSGRMVRHLLDGAALDGEGETL